MERLIRLVFITILLMISIPTKTVSHAEEASFVNEMAENNQPFATHRVDVVDYYDVLQHYAKVLADEEAYSPLIDSEVASTIQAHSAPLTFMMIDINADGADELLLKYNDRIFEIFTFYQGSIVQLLNMPSLINSTSLKLYQHGNIIISAENGFRALYQFKEASNTFALVDAFYPTIQGNHVSYYRLAYPDLLLTNEQVEERLRLKSLVPLHHEPGQWLALPKAKEEVEVEAITVTQSTIPALTPLPTPSSVYSVALSNYSALSFNNENTVHTPRIQLNIPERTIHIESPNHHAYLFDVLEIPTREIIVESADGSGPRIVKVNTQLFVTHFLEGELPVHSGQVMYLFYNRNGGISIAVPNLADGSLIEYATLPLH